jgi:hypothetical protein
MANIAPKSIFTSNALIFVLIYILDILLLISSLSPSGINSGLFVSWTQIKATDLVGVGAAIAASFFLPGYALMSITDQKHELAGLPKIILSILFSMGITGAVGYLTAGIFGISVSNAKLPLLIIYSSIIIVYIWRSKLLDRKSYPLHSTISLREKAIFIERNKYEIIVFASLLSFVTFYTYYLYGGTIVGDHWFHHGRALAFLSGSFQNYSESGVDWLYPPFQSALYATFFSLSNLPTVNAYVTISFLNMLPVFAFYYFFKQWVPEKRRKAALLASTLFLISSGLGWLYVASVSLAEHENMQSELSSLELLFNGGRKTFDIILPGTFVIGSHHPEFSTGLVIIGLPAGFMLLGLLKEKMNSKLKIAAITISIATLGLVTHPEFFYFIIISSISPIVFKLPMKNNFTYAALTGAILIALLSDLLMPGSYLVSVKILDLPLVILSLMFVLAMWLLYSFKFRLVKIMRYSIIRISLPLKTHLSSRFRFYLSTVLVGMIAYLYIFTFVVWDTSSLESIVVQTSNLGQRDIPWFLYPIKLGVTGLLGLTFILSYFYKRFENEIFIFGLLIVVALFIGPYYDEHRFSKYILVGMSGLASLLIYGLISSLHGRCNTKFLARGFIIGLVATSTGLSTFMSAGYNSIALDNPDQFGLAPGRIYPPSPTEFSMYNMLYNASVNSVDYNVATLPKQNLHFGLLPELEGFAGIPRSKLLQSPLALNASTLEEFYSILENTRTGFIVLPKATVQNNTLLPEPLKFALSYFPEFYSDDSYIVLRVPELTPPLEGSDTAIVFKKDGALPAIRNKTILPFDSNFFPEIDSYPKIEINGETGLRIYGELWSYPLNNTINYIESEFRHIGEPTMGDAVGLKWIEGKYEYYVYLDHLSLKFWRTSVDFPYEHRLLGSYENKLHEGVWYNLKIMILNDSINVYLNDLLKLSAQVTNLENNFDPYVSKIGISTSNSYAEFKPLVLGTGPSVTLESYEEDYLYPQHYYPLTALALADFNYDVFTEGDLSVFSKKNVILTFDPIKDWLYYLEFVEKGGNLLILVDTKQFTNVLAKVNSLKAQWSDHHTVNTTSRYFNNISALTRNMEPIIRDESIESTHDMIGQQHQAAFAVTAKLGNGSISLLDTEHLFADISNLGHLSNIVNTPTMIEGGESERLVNKNLPKDSPLPAIRFIGYLHIIGNFSASTSSFSMGPSFDTGFISEQTSVIDKNDPMDIEKLDNDLHVNKLLLYGKYFVTINSTSYSQYPVLLPTSNSYYDNVEITLPTGFDMNVKLSNGGKAIIFSENATYPTRVSEGEILFRNITSVLQDIPLSSVIMKRPEISVIGNASFERLYPSIPIDPRDLDRSWLPQIERETDEYRPYASGIPKVIIGGLNMSIKQIDDYWNPYGPYGQSITYDSYLSFSDNATRGENYNLELPMDISQRAKVANTIVPLEDAFNSGLNFLAVIIAISVAAIPIIFRRRFENVRVK